LCTKVKNPNKIEGKAFETDTRLPASKSASRNASNACLGEQCPVIQAGALQRFREPLL